MDSRGERLKKIRLEKGISLEEAQKKTKIHLNILKAIEGEGLTDLSPVYLKGFLKIYCGFLGVDPKDYISDYKEIQTKPSFVILSKEASQRLPKTSEFLKTVKIKFNSLRPNKKIRRVIAFSIALFFLSVGLFNLGKIISSKRRDNLNQKHSSSPRQVTALSKREQKPAQGGAASVIPKPQKQNLAGIKLVIRARDNCWISLKVDGELVFHRVLEKGRFESWQAKDKIEFSLGDAGAVELEVNSQSFSKLGRKGQSLKNILITKEGLSIAR